MRSLLIVVLVALTLLGCLQKEPDHLTTWEAEALAGKRLTLIDPKRLEEFRFGADNQVVANIGFKDGPMAGPILFWRISGNKLLLSELPNTTETYDEQVIVSKRENLLSVRRKTGESAQYKVGKSDASEETPSK